MFVSISLSAKRCASCPSPSPFSHAAIGCIAGTDFFLAGTLYPVLRCKERHTRGHWVVRPTIGTAEQDTRPHKGVDSHHARWVRKMVGHLTREEALGNRPRPPGSPASRHRRSCRQSAS